MKDLQKHIKDNFRPEYHETILRQVDKLIQQQNDIEKITIKETPAEKSRNFEFARLYFDGKIVGLFRNRIYWNEVNVLCRDCEFVEVAESKV